MNYLASLAVLLTFAVAQSALAEDQNNPQQQKKTTKKVVTHTPTGVHNPQVTHKGTTNPYSYHGSNVNVHNTTNVHVTNKNTGIVNPAWNKQVGNAASAKAVTNTQNWKNNPNLKNTNWKSKNWWATNPQWKANHTKWANNYHHWDRVHHDQSWWTNHYTRFAVFGGGYYYWNNGFWYPAYGYDPYFNYGYDAPIYAYQNQEPAQVVADVQNALSQAGYDPGPVDNTYGPQTRDALLHYQADNGLPESGQIDEATMASLGLQ